MNATEVKPTVHFTDSALIQATNPITVNLIGAGGTGSQVLTALARINHALNELDHAGLDVRLWDDDTVATANLGRQLFAECELGMYKSVALINRINRFFGTNWKAENRKFEKDIQENIPKQASATITISCVDSVKARFDIAEILSELKENGRYYSHTPFIGYKTVFGYVFGIILFGNQRRERRENHVAEDWDCAVFRYRPVFSQLLDIGAAHCQSRRSRMVYFHGFSRLYLFADGRTLDKPIAEKQPNGRCVQYRKREFYARNTVDGK